MDSPITDWPDAAMLSALKTMLFAANPPAAVPVRVCVEEYPTLRPLAGATVTPVAANVVNAPVLGVVFPIDGGAAKSAVIPAPVTAPLAESVVAATAPDSVVAVRVVKAPVLGVVAPIGGGVRRALVRSAGTSSRNVGAAAEPVVGPAKTLFADAVAIPMPPFAG